MGLADILKEVVGFCSNHVFLRYEAKSSSIGESYTQTSCLFSCMYRPSRLKCLLQLLWGDEGCFMVGGVPGIPADTALLNPNIRGASWGLRHLKSISRLCHMPFVSILGQVFSVVSLGVGSFTGDPKSCGSAKQ